MATAYFRFSHVDIIESLPPFDGYSMRTGLALFADHNDRRLPARYVRAATRNEFVSAIDASIDYARGQDRFPVLHLETHGSNDGGLYLGSGEVVSWRELKDRLIELNQIGRMGLLVFIAACNGARMVEILEPHETAPFRMMIGPNREVSYKEIMEGCQAFYRVLAERASGDEAVEALNAAVEKGDEPFQLYTAEQIFRGIMSNVLQGNRDPNERRAQLRRIIRRKLEKEPHASLEQRAAWVGRVGTDLHNERWQHRYILERFFRLDRFPQLLSQLDGVSYEDCVDPV